MHYKKNLFIVTMLDTNWDTTYSISMKYTHGCALFCCGYISYYQLFMDSSKAFDYIIHGYFTGTGAIVWLPHFQIAHILRLTLINSLAPRRYGSSFKSIIFKVIKWNNSYGTCCEISFRRMPQNRTNENLILVQVMGCCRQATTHYLNQCWPTSLSQ